MKRWRILLVGVPVIALIAIACLNDNQSERIGLDGDIRPWTLALGRNYLRARLLNDPTSQYLLGQYEVDWNGDGDAALYWFRLAARAGNADAMQMMESLEEAKNNPKGSARK